MNHTQIATLLGGVIGNQNLEDLIFYLPDEFFRLDDHGKERAWLAALHLANRGERNPEVLAGAVHEHILAGNEAIA